MNKIISIKKKFLDSNIDMMSFRLRDFLVKPNGTIDEELVKKLQKNNILNKMYKNCNLNYPKKLKGYRILLDNNEWVDGEVIGKSL